MSKCKDRETSRQVMSFLHAWDRGNKTQRGRMLRDFLSRHAGMTRAQLEESFAQVASLFLTRLTAWMRLTYLFGTCLGLQLRAVGVFLSATNSHQYMTEFLEVGGVMTLLEILRQQKLKDESKTEALRLLQIISSAGQKYKEFICESYGVKAIAECMARSAAEETQEASAVLLKCLAEGNSAYQTHVFRGLTALMTCTAPNTQRLVLQILQEVQTIVQTNDHNIVEPLVNVLRSVHVDVQYEAVELIKVLLQTDLRGALLRGLVSHLTASGEKDPPPEHQDDLEMSENIFLQQAAAARTIRILSECSRDLSEELLSLSVVPHLLSVVSNQDHADVQRQASRTLQHFLRVFPALEEQVCGVMGELPFQTLMLRTF